jgi:hypothetical protein
MAVVRLSLAGLGRLQEHWQVSAAVHRQVAVVVVV